MNKDTAARIIQRWFRSKFAKNECVISHSNFLSSYEVVLDKQTYNANELLLNLRHSSLVPHSRRELSDNDVEYIHERYDPFDTTYRKMCSDDYNTHHGGCSPKPCISLHLNKASILCV